MATIKDIAKELGISTSTVSVVLRGKAEQMKIAQKTQEKIWKTAQEMDYRPNISARRLRSSEAKVVYIAVYYCMDYRAYYMIKFLAGLREKACKMDCKIEFIIKQYEVLKETFEATTLYHAAIVCNASAEDIEYLESLPDIMPIVIYNRASSRYSTVGVDNASVGKMAVDILAGKNVRSTALVKSPSLYRGMDEMSTAFQNSCRERNISVFPIEVEDSLENGAKAAEIYCIQHMRTDAVFITSSQLSYGALNTFLKHGIKIPEQMRFLSVGSGISSYDEYAYVRVSTLDIPREAMAARCLEIALQLINKEIEQPVNERFKPVYIERDSC